MKKLLIIGIYAAFNFLTPPKPLYAQGTESEIKARLSTGQSVTLTSDIALSSPIMLPVEVNTRSKKILINLNGYTIYDVSTEGLPYLIARKAPDQTTALNKMQDVAVIIRDGAIVGKKGTGPLVSIDATYGTIIEGVTFRGGTISVDLHFALMGVVRNCLANAPDSVAFNLDRGRWLGANSVNSQSNHSLVEQCRVFNSVTAYAAFMTTAASGVIHRQIISEGRVPRYHAVFNSEKATVVKDMKYENIHLESTKGNGTRSMPDAGFRVTMSGGYGVIDGIFSQYDMTLIDVDATNYPHLYVNNTGWLTSGTRFKTTGNNVVWNFNETPPVVLTDPLRWSGGIVPFYMQQKYLNQSEIILKKP